ncbi:MAG: AAA family ATPase [Acidobacteria bacterium]|nr:AAA family ATPase [Acidobacteriota bacterium]
MTSTQHHTPGANVVPMRGEAPTLAGIAELGTAPAVRKACRAELDAHNLSHAKAAREIGRGVSTATLSKWLRGNYEGDNAAVTARIRTWLETRREQAKHAVGGAGLDRHVEIGVTAEIETVLAYAQAGGDVVLVHGRSGAGKSHAVERYCGSHTAAYRLMMTGAVTTLAGLLARIATAVGAGDRHGSALAAETEIVARLRDRRALLVVDEAHHLSARLLDELRCIRDLAGCGLALVGDDTLWSGLAGAPRCAQIVGRIGWRLPLGAPADVDVQDIAGGVLGRQPTSAEARLLVAAARGAGGMHALRRLLIRAWVSARSGARDAISAADLALAAEEGGAA